jgi:CubicO group peptidase (beta-lactamase class C family)
MMMPLNKLARAVLCLLFLYLPYSAATTAKFDISIEKQQLDDLKHEIVKVISKHKVVGFQLALNTATQNVWTMNYGLASVANNVDVDDTTLFRIASISKTVTAVAAMQLVEQGKLDLNVPIMTYIPEIEITNYWRDSSPITLLHLLEHTAGFDDNHLLEYVVDGSSMSSKEALDFHPHTRTSRYPPGLFMSYANIGPTLIAYLVEKITGLTFEQYVQKFIFEPLDMSHSGYFFSDHVKQNLATGYIRANGEQSIAEPEFIKDRASGAIMSNAGDMANFQSMLINLGSFQELQILKPSSIKRMSITESTLAAKAGWQDGYGKFMITQGSLSEKWLGHNGEMNGYLSAMWHNPARSAGYLFFSNSNGDSAYKADREINNLLREFINKHFAKTQVETAQKNTQVGLSPQSIEQYNKEILGHYRQYTSRLALFGIIEGLELFSSVFVDNAQVKLATSHSTYTLLPIAENVFSTQLTNGDEIRIVFIEHEGQWYYQIPSIFINAVKTNRLTKVASYVLLISFVLMTLLILAILILKPIVNLFGYRFPNTGALGWIVLGNMGLISCLIILGAAGSTGMPQHVLGQASVYSVGVLISLLTFFIFTLLSIFKFHKLWQQPTFNTSSKFIRYVSNSAILTNVVMLATLYCFDFLFVILWQH